MATPRLKSRHHEEVAAVLQQEFGYTSPMAIPTVKKIVLNIGLGEALTNARALDAAGREGQSGVPAE